MVLEQHLMHASKLRVVPHGAPAELYAPRSAAAAKASLGVEGRPVVSTFGLLSSGKGIEVALEAMARVRDFVPDVAYVIAGRTHPEVVRTEGEKYREGLKRLVRDLDLEDNVIFLDRFLDLDDLACPHSPGTALHQDGLSRLHRRVIDESLQRGQAGQRQRSGDGVGDRRRLGGQVGRGYGDEIGRGAVAVELDQSIDLVAGHDVRDAVGDRGNHAGHLVGRDHGDAADAIAGPGLVPRQLVEGDGGGVDGHQDLPGGRHRHRAPAR